MEASPRTAHPRTTALPVLSIDLMKGAIARAPSLCTPTRLLACPPGCSFAFVQL